VPLDVETLFREHNVLLFRYLVRLSGDEAMAKDAVQHAFLRMLEQQPDGAHPRAWLYTVATNAVRDWTSRDRRRKALVEGRGESGPLGSPEPLPDEGLEAREEARRVRLALASLSVRDRTILLMRSEGFRHREIADAVGTTVGSVGTMISRAVERFARALGPARGEAG
jgi:RNA polymerase sigma-70 factor (ECF subfamily)